MGHKKNVSNFWAANKKKRFRSTDFDSGHTSSTKLFDFAFGYICIHLKTMKGFNRNE